MDLLVAQQSKLPNLDIQIYLDSTSLIFDIRQFGRSKITIVGYTFKSASRWIAHICPFDVSVLYILSLQIYLYM